MKPLDALIVALALVVICGIAFYEYRSAADCEARGGVLVRGGLAGHECVEPRR